MMWRNPHSQRRGSGRQHASTAAGPTASPKYDDDLEHAAGLVTTVARIIPAPWGSLSIDDPSWAAFDDLLTEAAHLVAGRLGLTGLGALRALQESSRVTDPVRQLLIQRALERLTADERSS